MEKLLIIDGSSLLFQSFYGMPSRIRNEQGENVEAVLCFTGILFKTIRLLNPDKLFIVFDGENQLERRDINPEYKANRTDFASIDEDQTPFPQLEIIKKVLTSLNFTWVETTNNEADDIIASMTNDLKNQYEIIISSQDKDFFQLINKNVSVFVYRGKVSKLWKEEDILLKYGFEPKYFSTLKALVGDPSDNIKGVNGIGNKTATKLICEFGDLENLLKHLDKKTKTSQLILNEKDRVIDNFKIINLKDKTNLIKPINLEFSLPQESSTTVLKKLNII